MGMYIYTHTYEPHMCTVRFRIMTLGKPMTSVIQSQKSTFTNKKELKIFPAIARILSCSLNICFSFCSGGNAL